MMSAERSDIVWMLHVNSFIMHVSLSPHRVCNEDCVWLSRMHGSGLHFACVTLSAVGYVFNVQHKMFFNAFIF